MPLDPEFSIAINDPLRLKAVESTGLLDVLPIEEFDRLTRLLSRVVRAPRAQITMVDDHRQFFLSVKDAEGSPLGTARETTLDVSLCKSIVAARAPLVIHDLLVHPLAIDNALIRDTGIGAYLGVPLITDEKHCIGAFCAIDFAPRVWTAEDIATIQDLAESVMAEFKVRDEVRKQAQADQSLSLLAKALDAAHDVVLITEAEPIESPGPRIVYVNEAFTRMTGYSRDEVIGRTPRLLQGEKTDREALDRIRRHLKKWKPIRVDVLNYRKDGSEFWVELDIRPVCDENGWYTHWISVQRDMVARKEEERLSALAREAAEAANLAKSQFLANMSHEIRTPMAAILGYVDMLREPHVTPAERDQMLQTMRRSGTHLMTILNDILDLSRIEAGKMEMDPMPYPPWQVALEVVSSLGVLASDSGVRLEIKPAGKLPGHLIMDPTRIRQVLMNLVGNAIKFSKPGDVVLVRLRAETASEGENLVVLEFDVEDQGIGMTPEQRQKLFEPFEQGDKATTRRYGGAGLGLSISRRLLTAMGGDISLTSSSGEGTLFTVRIPLELVKRDEPWVDMDSLTPHGLLKPQTPSAHPSAGPLAGEVLIAEDSPEILKILSYHLKKAGLAVETATNGKLAMESALAKNYDLILMDMQMPELDGYGATRALRRSGYSGPILAITAHAMREDRDKCLDAGCTGYLTKPVTPKVLLEEVARYVAPRSTT